MKEIEDLYEQCGKRIFNYFYYLTYDVQKADDLTQETFYQAIVSIAGFKGKCSLKTWVYGIARNVFLKSLRHKKHTVESMNESYMETMPDEGQTPEEALIKKDRADMIRRTICSLPENYATLLILRDREGFSYQEVARITGMSEASVKVGIHRARMKFRDLYTKISDGVITTQ